MTTLRILIAEDNEDHWYLLARALRRVADVDVHIDETRDGRETLDYLHQRGPDAPEALPHLVFLDLQMPNVDGFGVLADMHDTPHLAGIPVVVLTSSSQLEDISTTYMLGGNSYVTKAHQTELRGHLQHVAEYWSIHAEVPHAAA